MIGLSSRIKYAVTAGAAAMALLFSAVVSATPARPEPPRLVNDLAGVMTQAQADSLEQRLVAYSDSTTTQIAVLVVPDLEGQDASSYAIDTHESWGVGSAGNDNGALILVKPKNENGGGEVFISIGYGLEGAIPDAYTKRIIEDVMIPCFIKEDYFGAIQGACDKIIRLADGEDFSSESSGGEAAGVFGGVFVLGIFLLILWAYIKRGGTKNGGTGGTGGEIADRTHPGPIHSGGSFSGGSPSSGGFGGFGGGSTGGAGAGGKW